MAAVEIVFMEIAVTIKKEIINFHVILHVLHGIKAAAVINIMDIQMSSHGRKPYVEAILEKLQDNGIDLGSYEELKAMFPVYSKIF